MKRFFLLCCLSFSLLAFAAQEESKPAYDLVVAQDGSGDFTSIQEAIHSLRAVMTERKIVFIKKGIYREKIVVPTYCTNITLLGEDRDNTIIRWGDHANMPIPGTETNMGTFRTYTLLVQGHGFRAQNLTIENDAPQLGQAVALHVEGDKASFINCRILGNQDTIFAGSETSRQYYRDCYIEGTTDFIFGSATAYFLNCRIHCKRNSYITAPSTPEYRKYGFIFKECKVTADEGIRVYLGRPWRPHGNTVFVQCELGACIRPQGWNNWRNPENEKTARFYECLNTGPGAWREGRVSWAKNLEENALKDFTVEAVLAGKENWNPEM